MSDTALAVISIVLLLLFAVTFLFIRRKQKATSLLTAALHQTLLLVTLPKVLPGREESVWNNEMVQEAMGLMESFLAAVAGLKVKTEAKNLLSGRTDHFSFEVVAKDKEIFFYIASPERFVDFIKQNIQAAFPAAHIDVVRDYNIFQPKGYSAAALLRFAKSFALPLKTYRQIDGDPLNHITNALSKLEHHEGAAIQFVVRSAHKRWHRLGSRIAHEMQQGKSYREALKIAERGMVGKTASAVAETVTKKKQKKEGKPPESKERYQLSPLELEMVKGVEQKTSKAGLEVNIRVVVSTQSSSRSDSLLSNIINSFSQYSLYEYGNKFESERPRHQEKLIRNFILRTFDRAHRLIVNTEEFASLYHFPLPSTETPNIRWLRAKRAPAPVNLSQEGVIIGKNIYRDAERIFRIALPDRRRHVYAIGMTGVGKSALLQTMAAQDIANGYGVAVIDPHGDLAESLLALVPPSRVNDVVYFNPADVERPIGLNMLEAEDIHEQDFAIQEMIMIFYKLVTDPSMIGPMFEHNMRNAMLTLMANPEEPGTITEIPRMFTDVEFQKYKLKSVTDPMVRAFWEKEMAKTSDFHKSEMLGYLISKVGRFVENTMMRNIIGQPRSGMDITNIVNEGKILIVNLSKGKIGEVNSNLLGLIVVSKLEMAAFSRTNLPENKRKDFFLYIDEFQNYTTDSIATILSEARKYRLNLTMAHQYLGQLTNGQNTKVRDAVLGNVGTMVAFRIGVEDTETMVRQFEPVFNEYDLVNVDKYNAFVRTLIDNAPTKPFSIETFPPLAGNPAVAEKVKQRSRATYGKNRDTVEREILERSKLGALGSTAAVEKTL